MVNKSRSYAKANAKSNSRCGENRSLPQSRSSGLPDSHSKSQSTATSPFTSGRPQQAMPIFQLQAPQAPQRKPLFLSFESISPPSSPYPIRPGLLPLVNFLWYPHMFCEILLWLSHRGTVATFQTRSSPGHARPHGAANSFGHGLASWLRHRTSHRAGQRQ
jgi:hypothetical protein